MQLRYVKLVGILIITIIAVGLLIVVAKILRLPEVAPMPINANAEFNFDTEIPKGNNKRARVVILAGQSNASGHTRDEYLKKYVSTEKYQEYENGYENVFINYYVDNGSNKSNGFVNLKNNQGVSIGCFGPELGLGEKLSEKYPHETVFIIKFAWSATSIYDHWLSQAPSGNICTLYEMFIKFVRESMEYLEEQAYQAKLVGICWMQGESDALLMKATLSYQDNLTMLIANFRKDLNQYASHLGMLFVDAGISDCVVWKRYQEINFAKINVAKISYMNFYIDTIANKLTYQNEPMDNPDVYHYDALSQIKLGHLFASYF